MCGEKVNGITRESSIPGSPPRVRGKVKELSNDEKGIRITPACAGKRIQANTQSDISKDHPRVCGEKLYLCNL